jgi:hypothetical protein
MPQSFFANESVYDRTTAIQSKVDYGYNLKEAAEHKDEHIDQYIETARQEAEAQGVHINLKPPKE